jgi:hypothetical protein
MSDFIERQTDVENQPPVETSAENSGGQPIPPFAAQTISKPLFTPINTDDFLKFEIDKAEEEAEKSRHEHKESEKSTSQESTQSKSGDKPPSGSDPSSPTFHKATADVIVEFYDLGLSYLGMFISKDEERDEYQIKSTDKAKLKSLTADYLATVKMNRQLPPWLPLVFFALVIALGIVAKARKRKKEKESLPAAHKNSGATPDSSSLKGPVTFPVNPGSTADHSNRNDLAPYWKKGNPVSEKERERRHKLGTPVCDTCQINHVRTQESKRCSKECSGEATKRIRGKSKS